MDEHMKNYLAHHGVAGQKWGQRHGPPYPLNSNPSKQAKLKAKSKSSYNKLYGDNSAKKKTSVMEEIRQSEKRYNEYTDKIYTDFSNTYKKKLKKLLDTPITIKKDQNLQRYSTHKKLSDEKWNSKYSYVSYTKKDNLAYKTTALGNKLSEDITSKNVYKQSLRANRDLKIMPFSEVMKLVNIGPLTSDMDTDYKTYVLDTFADKSYIKKFVPVEDQKGYFNHLETAVETLSDKIYYSYGEPKDGYNKLVEEASKQGYQGMVDVEDFLRPYYEKPIILFNPDSNVRTTRSTIVKKTSDKPIYDEYTPRMENYYKNDKIGVKKLGGGINYE